LRHGVGGGAVAVGVLDGAAPADARLAFVNPPPARRPVAVAGCGVGESVVARTAHQPVPTFGDTVSAGVRNVGGDRTAEREDRGGCPS
jgi:hypothetical protein